jgi:hypothetical protein
MKKSRLSNHKSEQQNADDVDAFIKELEEKED